MSAPGFTVWVAGPDAGAVQRVADDVVDRLARRHVAVELLDGRTPDVEALYGGEVERRVAFVARLLARHGVATVIAIPSTRRAERERARTALGRMIEIWVHRPDQAPPDEIPERPEVEVVLPELSAGAGADRALTTLEVLDYLPRPADTAYSADEEREVIRRLKSFGYL